MNYENVYVFGGIYDSKHAARGDYDQLPRMYDDGVIGPFQAAMVEKHHSGRVQVVSTKSTTRAEETDEGAMVGAAIGLIFPPAIPLTMAQGAAIGAAVGDSEKGWTRGDVKRLAEDKLAPGEVGVIVAAEAGPALDAAAILAAADVIAAEEVTAEHLSTYRDLLESDGVLVLTA